MSGYWIAMKTGHQRPIVLSSINKRLNIKNKKKPGSNLNLRYSDLNYSRNPHDKDHLTTETPALCDHFWPSPELFLLYSCLSNTRYGDHPPPRLVTTCSQSRTGCLNSYCDHPGQSHLYCCLGVTCQSK